MPSGVADRPWISGSSRRIPSGPAAPRSRWSVAFARDGLRLAAWAAAALPFRCHDRAQHGCLERGTGRNVGGRSPGCTWPRRCIDSASAFPLARATCCCCMGTVDPLRHGGVHDPRGSMARGSPVDRLGSPSDTRRSRGRFAASTSKRRCTGVRSHWRCWRAAWLCGSMPHGSSSRSQPKARGLPGSDCGLGGPGSALLASPRSALRAFSGSPWQRPLRRRPGLPAQCPDRHGSIRGGALCMRSRAGTAAPAPPRPVSLRRSSSRPRSSLSPF